MTLNSAECMTRSAPFSTIHAKFPLCDRVTLVMLNELLNSSFCRIAIESGISSLDRCISASNICAPIAFGVDNGTLSFIHVNVSGKSPIPTTHCMLARSPELTSRANSNGAIFGGTEYVHDIDHIVCARLFVYRCIKRAIFKVSIFLDSSCIDTNL